MNRTKFIFGENSMLYQIQHSVLADKVTLESGVDLNFPFHIHNSFEIIIAADGEIEVTVANNKHIVSGNECVLIFPNQPHEIKAKDHSRHAILIFSPQLVMDFSKKIETKIPKSNSFYLNDFYIDKITQLDGNKNKIEVKGLLYSICGAFDKTAEYVEFSGDKQNLLFEVFNFVSKNYKGNCSLYDLSKKTAYSYVYLSKHFSKNIGISYTEYVCRFRINEACYLLANTNNSILSVACECGFDCLRSFNRNFKSIMGTTPTKYRDQNTYKQH